MNQKISSFLILASIVISLLISLLIAGQQETPKKKPVQKQKECHGEWVYHDFGDAYGDAGFFECREEKPCLQEETE